ncbi:MAG: DnaJ domain-containing protein [Micavibrio aeruginosavorus]|uniref:DnaJ domain-containing protein n=1 Tax=Micavibrio aeruginosavorus TaxID=349221 RepID=A0A7T5R1W5_9BACT|nr:MAG: DnaJ domain-containing protein [Micavibrio aeruginosavorus]
MPYVLLVMGAAIGLFGLYKFFVSANPKQIRAFLLAAVFFIISIALLFMAVTGRLPAAIALALAIWPIALAWWKAQHNPLKAKSVRPAQMTRGEALKILGLTDTATAEDIEEAYKRLIVKVHPDQQGSDWMATKLNEARDLLQK